MRPTTMSGNFFFSAPPAPRLCYSRLLISLEFKAASDKPSHPAHNRSFSVGQTHGWLSASISLYRFCLFSLHPSPSTMTSPSSDDIVSQRRGSAASSVSVTIETTTTSTALNPGDTSVPSPVRLSSIEPFAGRPLSPLPTTCSEPPCLPLLPPSISVEMEPNTAAYQFPPPPYTSPPSQSSTSPPRACVTPLSFFPFSTLTPVTSTFPPLPEACSNPIPSPPSAPSSQFSRHLSAPPRCFWWGFLCPLIWFAGVYRLWRSERPAAFSGEKSSNGANVDVEAQVEVSMREMGVWSGYPERVGVMGKEEVQESLKLWREEEVLWGKRCAWSICAVLAIGAVIGIIVSSMLGKI